MIALGGWDPEEPGEYPANGTEEEQAEWNRQNTNGMSTNRSRP